MKKIKNTKDVKTGKFKSFFQNLFKNEKVVRRLTFFIPLIAVSTWLFWGLPLPTKLSSDDIQVSTKIFDRNNKLIYEIYTDQRRTPIKLEEIPQYIPQATIAIEDKDFYRHSGFSISGMTRALYKIVFKGKLEGGSTLTQQLVKTALLTPERTVKRKIREFVLTMAVETIYTKDQILEMYLNQIPYGSTAYGIEAASELYFGKKAKDLKLAEAGLLVGLTPAPTRYSPFGAHPELAKERQNLVLDSMVQENYIDRETADKTKNEELVFNKIKAPVAPHFALWVKEQLVDKYGEITVEQGGLRVYTTLDLDLQDFAQAAVATEVGKLKRQNVGNGAILVTRPKTGEILAMVGSKDFFAEDEDGKVNVILAKRQPGSSIKPINYALALRDGKINPATAIADVPTCFGVIGQPAYCPVNYDGMFHGLTQIRFALGNSFNVPAVKVLTLNGLENFVEFAQQMGLTTLTDPDNYGLSLTLGGGEVRPYDMAVAFGVFANQGIKQPLVAITKVEDWRGNVLEEINLNELELSGERVLTPEVSFLISHILYDNNARSAAFGEGSFLNVRGHPEVSVKTGTTNDRKDNWTVGYTAQIAAVTWVGNNDNKPMGGAVSGVSGASPIWNKVIKYALDKSESGEYSPEDDGHSWPLQPEGVVGRTVCSVTGLLPPGGDGDPGCPTRFEYFLKEYLPLSQEGERADLEIDKTTGQMAGKDTAPENIEVQNHPIYKDPLGTIYCLDCPIPTQNITVRYPLSI